MNVKEEDIRKIFEKMGETVRLTLVRVDLTGTNDGYALVRYSSADDARGVLDKYTKVEICGRKYATAPVEGSILIYNIDKKWKNEDVIKLLKETGTEGIEKVSLVVDPDNVGHNLGYGFVELQTCKDAQNAFDCKNLQRKLDKLQKVNVKVFLLKPVSDEKDSSSNNESFHNSSILGYSLKYHLIK
ncbi:hypothetical protein L6164_009194 [Bauhinia variegata]|uniref:Uncharacterized protein n=1 Tax=Bauhinia variegata TaxID=167791 RepID=A0ACB9PJB6_BAUVA|nr:hypothetical protein L6164_009194 [Bauhinia variegata]